MALVATIPFCHTVLAPKVTSYVSTSSFQRPAVGSAAGIVAVSAASRWWSTRGRGRRTRRQAARAKAAKASKVANLPKCVVFDLDGCLWSPEMYELSWERGGSPFNYDAGVMRDRRGCVISLYSGVDLALTELANEKKWQGVNVAVASCCDVPPWAFELLGKFEFGPKKSKMKMNESWIPGDSIRDQTWSPNVEGHDSPLKG